MEVLGKAVTIFLERVHGWGCCTPETSQTATQSLSAKFLSKSPLSYPHGPCWSLKMPRGFWNLSVNFVFLWEEAVKLLNNFWGVNIRPFPGPLAQVSVDTVQWCSPATASFNDKCSFRPWMNRDFSILAYNIHLLSICSAQGTGFFWGCGGGREKG